jgi:hypothetical protein
MLPGRIQISIEVVEKDIDTIHFSFVGNCFDVKGLPAIRSRSFAVRLPIAMYWFVWRGHICRH